MLEIAPGLWHWTAAHPDWKAAAVPDSPGDWEQEVGSVLCRTEAAAAFFDPILPAEAAAFWRWADAAVGERAVVVLTTIAWHRRDRAALVERYRAGTSRTKRALPDGVQSVVIRGAGETMFWLPRLRALIPGDRILGGPGGTLRVCPESWLSYLPSGITRIQLIERLRPLLELDVEMVLVSHGSPVLRDGARALERALSG